MTRNKSTEAGFGETPGGQSHSIADARCGARFVSEGDSDACSAGELLPQRIVLLANYHIEITFGQKHGDGSRVTGGIDCEVRIFDDVSGVEAICTYCKGRTPTLARRGMG